MVESLSRSLLTEATPYLTVSTEMATPPKCTKPRKLKFLRYKFKLNQNLNVNLYRENETPDTMFNTYYSLLHFECRFSNLKTQSTKRRIILMWCINNLVIYVSFATFPVKETIFCKRDVIFWCDVSTILFSMSLLPRSVEKRPTRLRLETEIQ